MILIYCHGNQDNQRRIPRDLYTVCTREVDTSRATSESAADETTARGKLLQTPRQRGVRVSFIGRCGSRRVPFDEIYGGSRMREIRSYGLTRGAVNHRAYATLFPEDTDYAGAGNP